ncbi:MAG: phosphoesterase PA-phosphatase [Eubacteriales bacterium]|nr:phosphoesterase PA-phosphatase [Eubacteriales bacterium]
MKEKQKRDLLAGAGLLVGFVVWTILIRHVDVQAAGVNGTAIGFATFHVWFHQMTGTNMTLYAVTDWLGLVPVVVCLCFGGLGFVQLIRRKSLLRVDPDILLLGGYYLLVLTAYLLFEMIPIHYRPVLINGNMEASYPSSTTLLVLGVMPTCRFQISRRFGNPALRHAAGAVTEAFSAFMVIGRLISGVHWVGDIIGSVLLSAGLFLLYRALVIMTDRKKTARNKEE